MEIKILRFRCFFWPRGPREGYRRIRRVRRNESHRVSSTSGLWEGVSRPFLCVFRFCPQETKPCMFMCFSFLSRPQGDRKWTPQPPLAQKSWGSAKLVPWGPVSWPSLVFAKTAPYQQRRLGPVCAPRMFESGNGPGHGSESRPLNG